MDNLLDQLYYSYLYVPILALLPFPTTHATNGFATRTFTPSKSIMQYTLQHVHTVKSHAQGNKRHMQQRRYNGIVSMYKRRSSAVDNARSETSNRERPQRSDDSLCAESHNGRFIASCTSSDGKDDNMTLTHHAMGPSGDIQITS